MGNIKLWITYQYVNSIERERERYFNNVTRIILVYILFYSFVSIKNKNKGSYLPCTKGSAIQITRYTHLGLNLLSIISCVGTDFRLTALLIQDFKSGYPSFVNGSFKMCLYVFSDQTDTTDNHCTVKLGYRKSQDLLCYIRTTILFPSHGNRIICLNSRLVKLSSDKRISCSLVRICSSNLILS